MAEADSIPSSAFATLHHGRTQIGPCCLTEKVLFVQATGTLRLGARVTMELAPARGHAQVCQFAGAALLNTAIKALFAVSLAWGVELLV